VSLGRKTHIESRSGDGAVKQHLSLSLKQFQAYKYKLAIETCSTALREAQTLEKDELTGLIHANLAAIFVKAKDDMRAIEHYKRALLFAQKSMSPGADTTPAHHERMFDLLDALAGCYSRRRDYSSALSVIDDQIRRFPQCPGRSERESMMYLNGGRVCCTLGKFDEAETHLLKAKAAAVKAKQTDIELNVAYWLSRALSETGKPIDALSLLDKAIPTAEEEHPENVELVGKLMLARLEWLHPTSPDMDANEGAKAQPKAATPMRIAQLWHTFEYFEKKQYVHGQLCASDALINALCAEGPPDTQSSGATGEKVVDEKHEADIMRALSVVDTVSIGKLPVADASILIRLVFLKVDMLLTDRESRSEAKALLAKTLRSLWQPGRNEVSRRQQYRAAALHRLIEIVQGEEEEDPDEEVYEFLEEATELLRREKEKDASAAVALGEMLRKVARFKASRGELVQAEELLEESAELPCGQMLVTLLPLCVVQLKQGNLRAAEETMTAMVALPDASDWKEVAMVKQQLDAARAVHDARRQGSKREDADMGATTAAASSASVSSWGWERCLWLPLSLCAVLVAALVALWL
jgi:tetratricopeptide (TPR) repeat protein